MRQSKSLGSLVPGTGGLKRKAGTSSSSARELCFPAAADAYELLDDCGRGVSATVWRARCLTNNEIVAVKILNLEAQMAPLEDIVHEAQTMKAYKHEAVLGLYVCFVHETQLWMVMPYMEGGSVAHIMRYRYPDGLQEAVIATIMKEVLSALAYIHSNGDIHRDVKAGNILVDGDGHVKLGDFGVAASMERQDWGAPQGRNTFAGTPCWMAPEVLEQDRYGPKADIWSAGITMLELVHGHAPFSKLPPIKVLLLTLQGPPPQLEAECGGRHFSRGMREVVASCLNKDPAKRPTAKQLLSKGFFRQSKDAEYLKRTILAGLPPLPQRVMEIRMGKGRAATLASQNDRAAMASHISYITDVAQWDFNCTRSTTGTADSASSLLPAPAAAAAAPDGLPEPSNAVGSVSCSLSRQAGSRDDQQLEQPHSHQQQLQAGQADADGAAASALGSSNSLDVPGQQQQHGVVGLEGFLASAQQQQQAAAGDAGPGSRDVDTGSGAADTDRVAAAGAVSAVETAEKVPSLVRQPPPQSPRTSSPAAAAATAGGGSTAGASAAAQAKVLTCTLGGRTITAFPVSVPDTPDHSPMHSRPNTPELRAAEAAAALAAAGADSGRLTRGPAVSYPGAAAAGNGTTGGGAAVAGAKKHGRFTYVEGSSRYQGPDLVSDGSPKAAAAGASGGPGLGAGGRGYELLKQRSVSSPDMALLMSLQAAGHGSTAAAAATAAGSSSLSDTPVSPASPASPASSAAAAAAAAAGAPASAALSSSGGLSPRQQQQWRPAEASHAGTARPSSPAGSGSSSSLLAKLLPHKQAGDAVSPRRPRSPVSPAQQQQQQQHEHHEHHLLPHKLAGFLAHHGLGKSPRGASPLSSRDASPGNISGHGGTAHDAEAAAARSSRVQPSDALAATAGGGQAAPAAHVVGSSSSSSAGGAAKGSLSRAGASLQEIYPDTHAGGRSDAAKSPRSYSPRAAAAHGRPGAGPKEHATAGQIWQHVKEACAETASDVAHIFRSRSGGSLQHSDRSLSRSPERPPTQHQEQQQQQPLSPPSPRPATLEHNEAGETRQQQQQQQQSTVAEPPGAQHSSSTADARKLGSSSLGAAPVSSGGPAGAAGPAVAPPGSSSSNLVRLGSRGSIPAVSLADMASAGSSSSSKPPRYQQGPTKIASREQLLKQPLSPPRQSPQQQQQQAGPEPQAGAKQQQVQQELQQLQQQPGIPEEDVGEAAAAVTTLAAAAEAVGGAAAVAAAAAAASSAGPAAEGPPVGPLPLPQAGACMGASAAPGVASPPLAAAAAQASLSAAGSVPGLSDLGSRELSVTPGLATQPSSGSSSSAAAAADRLSSHALADSPEKQQQGGAQGPLGRETSVTFPVVSTRGSGEGRTQPQSPQQEQQQQAAHVQDAPALSAAMPQAWQSADGGTTLLELRGIGSATDSDTPARGRTLLTAADAAAGAAGAAALGQEQQQLLPQQPRAGSQPRPAHTSASPSRRHKGRFTIIET